MYVKAFTIAFFVLALIASACSQGGAATTKAPPGGPAAATTKPPPGGPGAATTKPPGGAGGGPTTKPPGGPGEATTPGHNGTAGPGGNATATTTEEPIVVPEDKTGICTNVDNCIYSVAGDVRQLPTTQEEIDEVCRVYDPYKKCISDWSRRCLTVKGMAAVQRVTNRSDIVMKLLCEDHSFQTEYLGHGADYAKVRDQFDVCIGQFQNYTSKYMAGSDKTRHMCCSWSRFNKCVSDASKDLSSSEAGSTLRRMLSTVYSGDGAEICRKLDLGDCAPGSSATRVFSASLLPVVLLVTFGKFL